ncbi:MAG: PDZ domain-containing protein [Lentisphaeraceae bacterium]|nr:PDZ domain-containing protein [Lentisphaeraceae bacterium]
MFRQASFCWLVSLLFFSTYLQAGFFSSDEKAISGREYLQSVQKTVEETTAKVAPSVVYLDISLKKPGRTNSITLNGVFIDDKGHFATLYFKQEDVGEIKVWIGEQEVSAKIVKADRINGVTILKADSDEESQPVKFADTSKLVNGQFLVGVNATSKNLGFEAVGNLGNLKAIIEGARDMIMVNGFDMTHNNDIPTLGMPLFNLEGEMFAMNQGRSIALTDPLMKAVKKFVNRKEGDDEEDEEPWIGINYESISEELSKALNFPREAVRLTRVYEGSPAQLGGLQRGDLITGIDENKITRKGIRALSQVRKWLDPEVGRKVVLSIIRDGKEQKKEVVFAEKFKVTSISIEEFGLTVNDISPFDYYNYSLKVNEGVLVTGIEGGSPAATSTYFGRPLIQRGDVIVEVHGKKITNIQDLRAVLEELREKKISAVYIRMQRGNRQTSVSLDTAIGQKTKDAGDK